MEIEIKLAGMPWQVGSAPRGEDFDGSRIGEVAAYVDVKVTDSDGFEASKLVKLDAATVAKIADGTDKDPRKTVQGIVDAALVGFKAETLAKQLADAIAEEDANAAQKLNAELSAKVRAALGSLGAKAVGAVEDLEG